MSYDTGYKLALEPPADEDFSEEENDPEYEWGWLVITELVSDGRVGGEWFETMRYLYYSPTECRAMFHEMLAAKGWTLSD